MARSGMSDLIQQVRQMAFAGTADYSIGTVTYFTDDHIQDILDDHSERLNGHLLSPKIEYVGGSVAYRDFYWSESHPAVEGTASGTAVWRIQNSSGDIVAGSLYTVNARKRQVRFTTDQGGTILLLTTDSYDLYGAAVEILEDKATQAASRFDVSSDNHSLKPSQLHANYMKIANGYRKKMKGKVSRVRRIDMS